MSAITTICPTFIMLPNPLVLFTHPQGLLGVVKLGHSHLALILSQLAVNVTLLVNEDRDSIYSNVSQRDYSLNPFNTEIHFSGAR